MISVDILIKLGSHRAKYIKYLRMPFLQNRLDLNRLKCKFEKYT